MVARMVPSGIRSVPSGIRSSRQFGLGPLVNPQEFHRDDIASNLTARLSWDQVDIHGIAQRLRMMAPDDRPAVVEKMIELGADPPTARAALSMSFSGLGATDTTISTLGKVATVAGIASVPLLAYHGYKRNNSVGWALVWRLLASIVWPVSVPIALAQGFGKRASK